MNLTQPFRAEVERVSTAISDTFDFLMAKVNGMWNVQHKDDGSHSDITADTITVTTLTATNELVTNNLQITGNLAVTGNAAVTGAVTAASALIPSITANTGITTPAITAGGGVLTVTTATSANFSNAVAVTGALTAGSVVTTGVVTAGTALAAGTTVTAGTKLIAGSLVSTFGNSISYDGANQLFIGIPGTTNAKKATFIDSGGSAVATIDATGAASFNATVQGSYLIVTDGVTAPSATGGTAKIYVDTADGDLKIIFGDGTIKTIVTDT